MTILEYFRDYRLEAYVQGDFLPNGQFLEQPNPLFPRQRVLRRSQASRSICRLQIISPKAGELFYLRSLLLYVPARSFEQLRTVDGTVHPSFQDAAIALGLFADRSEAIQCLEEAKQLQS